MNMTKWLGDMLDSPVKKAMPVLSFPSVQLLGIDVKELIFSSDLQARGMKLIADRVDSAASVSMMDLSVEAEAFGSAVRISSDEVPTVVGSIIKDPQQAEALAIPEVGTGRTGLYVEAIGKAARLINDRPVLAGVIGPFSLAGRLLDVTEAMMYCYDEPEMVHMLLNKVSSFSMGYINAYKAAGADGVVIAEPLAGLLSPSLNEEFSAEYVKLIVKTVQTDDFAVIYHNCGNATLNMTEAISGIGAGAYHFGNAIDLEEMLKRFPNDKPVMGNIDPAGQFRNGTPLSIRENTLELLGRCSKYNNFVISSGCDIPAMSPWANIDAFFAAVQEFYS